jgi:carbon storage regulator
MTEETRKKDSSFRFGTRSALNFCVNPNEGVSRNGSKKLLFAKEERIMLVLTRKAGERILIDSNIVIEVLEVQGNRVRLGIQAPSGVNILREELILQRAGSDSRSDRPSLAAKH